jgi:lysophospholipase L1-like esterase
MRSRRPVVITSLVVVLSLLISSPASAASYPKSMAATGDSITTAYNTGFFPYVDNPSASWSTGTSTAVNSQYLRLLKLNPRIQGRNYNDAADGAKMANLAGQMQKVVSQRVQYVTVLMGGNDLCTSSVGSMTSVATFRSQLTSAMNTLTSGLPSVRVQVVSIPNAYHLWELFKDNFLARTVWAAFGVCQSLLADPLSTDADDVARRDAVRQRNVAYNDVLRDTCALYIQCRFDGYAVFNAVFVASDITGRDYFHPSTSGQAKLASVTWAAGFFAN